MGKILTDKRGNTWRYRFQIASSDGKRKYESKSGFPTQKEAYAEGVKAKAKYDATGIIFKAKEISFSDYLNQWIALYCEKNCAYTTINSYKKRIRLYIVPELGKYSLKQLTPTIMQTFINRLVESGMSRNTITDIKGILTSSLSYAVVPLQYLESSPMLYVKIPKVEKNKNKQKKHIFVEPEVWNEIITRFPKGHPSHIPLMLGYHCGLRLGEVFGLQWDDLDEAERTLNIRRQVQWKDGKWHFKLPKYDSCRIISIDDKIFDLLLDEHDKQQRAKEYYQEYYTQLRLYDEAIDTIGEPIDMIMVRENGTYIQPRTMQHVMRVIHGKANKTDTAISEQFDFHSLRHTHATMLYQAGVPLSAIKNRLGHTNIDITEIYTDHVTEHMNEHLKNALNNIF